VTPDRCPACGAACRPDAQWCSLCYADFRPPPAIHQQPYEAAAPSAPLMPSSPMSASPADPLTAPLALLTRSSERAATAGEPPRRLGRHAAPAEEEPDDAREPGPDADADADGTGPTWPSAACSTATPMTRSACDGCGSPFLAGLDADRPSVRLPRIGELTEASRPMRWGVAVAGAVVAMAVLIGLLTVVGLLF